ncbi:MAG: phosphatase PAP2 family protein [Bacteroidetes bacterium]|nr:phosphatase PAP2 family protein [Bacteroidota bacterium]MCY4233705.1 phosphatase PAP2 family protein [Bacteroidota bacterium]
MNLISKWWLLACFIGFISVNSAHAQQSDPLRFFHWMVGDVVAMPQSALSLRAGITLGVAVTGILAVSHYDRSLSDHAQSFANSSPSSVRRVFHEIGNERIIRPMAVILFVGALTSRNTYFQDAAFTSMESIFLANIFTNSMKLVVGRSRPNTDVGPRVVHPFSGHRSFPSGHATTVFAFTTPWLIYYPNLATGTLFVLGVGTAIARMADKHHWFSDVLGGALIGFGTGYILSRRHMDLRRGVNLNISANQFSVTWTI